MNREHLVPRAVGALVVIAGALAILATYWDEAWHTDVGRDSAWSAPHILLYGSVGVVGLGVAGWGLHSVVRERSLRAVLRQSSLVLAGTSGVAVLAAAPIDAAWHTQFGRDAVGWSPPHMLVLLGSTALILAVMSGLPGDAILLRTGAGALLLANAVAVVFEYEADVPQFSEIWYLPMLLLSGLVAAVVVRSAVPGPVPVTMVVAAYVGLRLAVIGVLALLGRSTPDLPIAVLGLAALDLPLRTWIERIAVAALLTSGLAWAASVLSVASPDPDQVGRVAAVVVAGGIVVLLASRLNRPTATVGLVLTLAALISAAGPAVPGWAHDPGQGDPVARVRMKAISDSQGVIQVRVEAGRQCDDLEPQRLLARRAGSVRSAKLVQTADCTFQGSIAVKPVGRWFTYVEFDYRGDDVEAWVPVDADRRSSVDETRTLYRPAGARKSTTTGQVVAGAFLYLVGGGLVVSGVRLNLRRRGRTPPGQKDLAADR